MYRKFLNARSPMRLLEKGLHGGLGKGNLGLVLAGHGVGKSSFLVGVALDDLLRGDHVLHVSLDQTVAHTRAFYDTVFDDLASQAHLEDEVIVHAEIDKLRSIRAYPPTDFGADKLREAVKLEGELGKKPGLVILEGLDVVAASNDDLLGFKSLAAELDAELWLSIALDGEKMPDTAEALLGDRALAFGVVLALEPGPDSVQLRALKDHENQDLQDLHVALDPKSLLLVRS